MGAVWADSLTATIGSVRWLWVSLNFGPLKAQSGLARQLAGGERFSGGDGDKVYLSRDADTNLQRFWESE